MSKNTALYERLYRFLDQRSREVFSALEREFSPKVCEFVLRVIAQERKKGGLEPLEIISISYSTLKNCQRLFREKEGNFDHYALRSLKNELTRAKRSKHLLWADHEEATEKEFQPAAPSTRENPFIFESEASVTEEEVSQREKEEKVIALIAGSVRTLTPLEKAIVFRTFWTSNGARISASDFEPIGLEKKAVLAILKKALSKVRRELETAMLRDQLSPSDLL